jgi:hypothetical protein
VSIHPWWEENTWRGGKAVVFFPLSKSLRDQKHHQLHPNIIKYQISGEIGGIFTIHSDGWFMSLFYHV